MLNNTNCISCGANQVIKHDIATECAYCGRLTPVSPVILHPNAKNNPKLKNHPLIIKMLEQNSNE